MNILHIKDMNLEMLLLKTEVLSVSVCRCCIVVKCQREGNCFVEVNKNVYNVPGYFNRKTEIWNTFLIIRHKI